MKEEKILATRTEQTRVDELLVQEEEADRVGCSIGIEPPLAETDHLWQELFIQEITMVYKSLVTIMVTCYIHKIRRWRNSEMDL